MTRKTCSKCKIEKPTSEFYKHKRKKSGLTSQCKDCYKEYAQSERGKEAHRRAVKKYGKSPNGKAKNREYSQSEKAKEAMRKYAQSPEGREVHRRASRKYEQTEKGKANRQRYLNSHKGKLKQKKDKAVRRANETDAGGSYTPHQWYELCKFYDFHCLRCEVQFDFEQLTLDHIKPISRGGTSYIYNLQPLCDPCNKIKGTQEIDFRQTLPDWLDRDGLRWTQGTLF